MNETRLDAESVEVFAIATIECAEQNEVAPLGHEPFDVIEGSRLAQ